MNEEDKFKLKQRVYPAIQSCVSNRYKIILGVFIYYGFILNNDRIFQAYKTHPYFNLISSLIFSAFIFHNVFNYCENSKERKKLEGSEEGFFYTNSMELIFAGVALFLIWIAYYLFSRLAV